MKLKLLSLALCAASALPLPAFAFESAQVVPAPAVDSAVTAAATQTAVLAGGCFWGLEAVFEHVRGVKTVRSGYAGGDLDRAEYGDVSSGGTGNAESVEIVFDPKAVSYGQLLQVYFSVATDPTQLNRQGPDRGTQYRGDIFYADADQEKVARAYVAQLDAAHVYSKPIVTRIDPLEGFAPAEAYHQNYLVRHPTQPYIVQNDLPKVENLKRLFPALYTEKRVD